MITQPNPVAAVWLRWLEAMDPVWKRPVTISSEIWPYSVDFTLSRFSRLLFLKHNRSNCILIVNRIPQIYTFKSPQISATSNVKNKFLSPISSLLRDWLTSLPVNFSGSNPPVAINAEFVIQMTQLLPDFRHYSLLPKSVQSEPGTENQTATLKQYCKWTWKIKNSHFHCEM